jgi:thiol-disulfide isomerase/thioredoxin
MRSIAPLAAALLLAGSGACNLRDGQRAELVPAPPGDVAATVRAESALAQTQNRNLLVYVTASWCGPCQRFHEAVRSGRLDGKLPRLRLLEFDLDRDDANLQRAGYRSKIIPLFARPGPDGRASGRAIEGAGSSAAAMDELVVRLNQLTASAR